MDNSRYRLITSIVVLFIYLLAMYPAQTITCVVIIGIAYFVIQNTGSNNGSYQRRNTIASKNYGIHSLEDELSRREALRSASLFLAPYNNIWGRQKISNKYCSMELGSNGYTITGRDMQNPARHFRITKSSIYSREELWNMFLISFSTYTGYDKLLELCDNFSAEYTKTGDNIVLPKNTADKVSPQVDAPTYSDNSMPVLKVPELKREKLDVNNASEVELTSLPGISIVTAKKLIKRREELKGFKFVEDVLSFLNLKPHMENQVKELICVKRMKGSDAIKRYNERNIDL